MLLICEFSCCVFVSFCVSSVRLFCQHINEIQLIVSSSYDGEGCREYAMSVFV